MTNKANAALPDDASTSLTTRGGARAAVRGVASAMLRIPDEKREAAPGPLPVPCDWTIWKISGLRQAKTEELPVEYTRQVQTCWKLNCL